MLHFRALVPAVMGVASLASAAAGGTVVRQDGVETLVRAAQRIVVTEVLEVRADRARGGEGEWPVSIVTLRVLETLKGRAALQAVLEIPGGRLDGISLEVSGMPRFRAGDRDVLFLHDTPGMLSPIVGVFAGRFRLHPGEGSNGLVVRGHDDGPLPAALLASAPELSSRSAGTSETALSAFTRAVRRAVAEATAGVARAPIGEDGSLLASRPSGVLRLPGCLRVSLGPSPALSDGCRDWECAVTRSLDAARTHIRDGGVLPAVLAGGAPSSCAEPATIEWGTAVQAGRLDDLTLAVVLRAEGGRADGTRIVLNGARAWNARDGQPAEEAGAPIDAVAVLSAALAALAAGPAPEGGGDSDAEALERAASARGPRRLLTGVSAADPCDGGGGAVVNPRLLIFDSPDHARLSGYQVGFFPPGAAAAASIVDLPLNAFLERRTFDLPPGAVEAMGRTLVAPIAGAGLATPPGRVFTYRVRGVWTGGATVWSDPSGPFVRCPQ